MMGRSTSDDKKIASCHSEFVLCCKGGGATNFNFPPRNVGLCKRREKHFHRHILDRNWLHFLCKGILQLCFVTQESPPPLHLEFCTGSGLGPSSPLYIYLQFRTPSINWIYLVQRIILVCGNLFTKNSVLKRGALKRKRNWILLVLYCSVRKENPAKKEEREDTRRNSQVSKFAFCTQCNKHVTHFFPCVTRSSNKNIVRYIGILSIFGAYLRCFRHLTC